MKKHKFARFGVEAVVFLFVWRSLPVDSNQWSILIRGSLAGLIMSALDELIAKALEKLMASDHPPNPHPLAATRPKTP